jgi:hypothetical protein
MVRLPSGRFTMQTLGIVIRFVYSRRWLVGVVVLNMVLTGMILRIPAQKKFQPKQTVEQSRFSFDEIVSHPLKTVSTVGAERVSLRGASLTGTIETEEEASTKQEIKQAAWAEKPPSTPR